MKWPKIALFLPATIACLGANVDDVGFRWYLGPVNEGRDCEIRVCFSDSKFPSAHAYAEISCVGPHGVTTAWHTTPSSTLGKDKKGYRTYVYTFPGEKVLGNGKATFVFGIAKEAYYLGIDFSKLHLRVKEVVDVKPDGGLISFEKNEVREMPRNLFAYDPAVDPKVRKIYHDMYESKGIVFGKSLTGRKVDLSALTLEYTNPYLAPNASPTAELRLLSFREEFAGIATDHGGYSSLPLTVKVSGGLKGLYTYRFSLKESYYYSRIDYSVGKKAPAGEPYFVSSDLFLPLRNGDDDALFSYQIVMQGAGHFDDEVILPSSGSGNRKFFGPCDEAQYCVHTGTEEKT